MQKYTFTYAVVNDGVIKTNTKLYTSLTFEEIYNFSGSAKQLSQEINSYIELMSVKKVQAVFDKYKELLEKTVTSSYTQETKDADIAAMVEKYDYLADLSLIPVFSDSRLNKLLQRNRINSGIRDTDDSIADLSKWNSLLSSMLISLYNAMDDATKANMTDDEIALIDSFVAKFNKTTTTVDNSDANVVMNKIFRREENIAKIIKGEL